MRMNYRGINHHVNCQLTDCYVLITECFYLYLLTAVINFGRKLFIHTFCLWLDSYLYVLQPVSGLKV